MDRIILHSDLNSFYASVEMMLDPSLRGKAVAVCGSTEDRHGIVRQSISESKNGIAFSPCKTKHSHRNIPIDDELFQILSEQKDFIGRKTSSKVYPRKFLIAGITGKYMAPGHWMNRHFNSLAQDFHEYCLANNLDMPLLKSHELRHSFGSILYNRTKDIVKVSKIMGHSSIEITVKKYIHETEDEMREFITHGV